VTITERLGAVPLFAGLPPEDLRRLCEGVSEVHLEQGECLFEEGDAGTSAYVIADGEIEIVKISAGRDVLLAVMGPGHVIGEMALLREMPRMASGRARRDTTLLEIPKVSLDALLESSPVASRRLLDVVLERWRANEAQLRQNERMAQLGTLTAGLAHEMNNPAGAVVRGAGRVNTSLQEYAATYATAAAALGADRRSDLDAAIADVLTRAGKPNDLDPLARADHEEAVEEWLEDRSVDRAWELAPALVDLGYDVGALEALMSPFSAEHVVPAITAIAVAGSTGTLVREVEEGATRLAAIVKALKSYTHLDQAPVQTVDLTVGLDDTLLILRSKLRDITVVRNYDPNLPTIEAYASELNQVWTNLLDNAADALADQDGAHIVITAAPGGMGVVVEVEDNGPGIPEDIRDRVFDSFFTTKPPGSGTGLGLDISRSIIITRHGGKISVDSRPGRTVFRVELPLQPPA
jgi:signal transduction histidine kinase